MAEILTHTITAVSDGDTFEVATPAIEVGMGLVSVLGELMAVDADGESFGDESGDIYIDFAPEVSEDGEHWTDASAFVQDRTEASEAGGLSEIGQRYTAAWFAGNYARLRWLLASRDGGPYAGSNAPSFTLSLKVSSLSIAPGRHRH
jgi:hypothetical protein